LNTKTQWGSFDIEEGIWNFNFKAQSQEGEISKERMGNSSGEETSPTIGPFLHLKKASGPVSWYQKRVQKKNN